MTRSRSTALALLVAVFGCTAPDAPTQVLLRIAYNRPPAALEIRGEIGALSLGPTRLPESPRPLDTEGESVTLLLPPDLDGARILFVEVRALDRAGHGLDVQDVRVDLRLGAAVSRSVTLRLGSAQLRSPDAAVPAEAGPDQEVESPDAGHHTRPTAPLDGAVHADPSMAEVPEEDAPMVTAEATMATPEATDLSEPDKSDTAEAVTPARPIPEMNTDEAVGEAEIEPLNNPGCSTAACLDAGDGTHLDDPVESSEQASRQDSGPPPADDAGAETMPEPYDVPDDPRPTQDEGEEEDEARCDLGCNLQVIDCLVALWHCVNQTDAGSRGGAVFGPSFPAR